MLSENSYNALAELIKSNPEVDQIIQSILADNKKFNSILVHELRNPLSLLKGTIQYIETKHPETKQFKYWDQLQDLVNDMEQLMADASLLNTCNIVNKEKTDLIALVNSIIRTFMPQAISQRITLSLSVDPECEGYFASYNCDPKRMKQVLSNLVKNAFEATKPGDYIHIKLSYIENIDSVPRLSLQVSNNGLPIPEDEIETIFTPFVTYKKNGTGVGLAVVKKIIDLHYGTIQVTSDEKETSFTILLPILLPL